MDRVGQVRQGAVMHRFARRSPWLLLLMAGTGLAAAPVAAQEGPPGAVTVSGTAALVSDYRFRGVSRSAGEPAVQASVTLDHVSGAYVGVWVSSLATSAGRGASELDLTAGYSRELLPGLTGDAGLQVYTFPGAPDGQRTQVEPYAAVSTSYGPGRVRLGVSYAIGRASLGGRDNLYVHGRLDVAVPGTPISLSGRLGYQDGPLAAAAVAQPGRRHGWDYALGAEATVQGRVTLGLSYVGASGQAVDRLTDDSVVASLTLSL
ncbi:MAG: TorF family putative porin [Sphingomonadales bacterium]|nr:TorF family putative porin [Sphingomonadales bacterium]